MVWEDSATILECLWEGAGEALNERGRYERFGSVGTIGCGLKQARRQRALIVLLLLLLLLQRAVLQQQRPAADE